MKKLVGSEEENSSICVSWLSSEIDHSYGTKYRLEDPLGFMLTTCGRDVLQGEEKYFLVSITLMSVFDIVPRLSSSSEVADRQDIKIPEER